MKRGRCAWVVFWIAVAAGLVAGPAEATQPPAPGVVPSAETIAALTEIVATPEAHGYLASVRDARLCRVAAAGGRKIACQDAVKGNRSVPVLVVEFKNRAAPYGRQTLQNVLFDSNPTGTMTQYYAEISYGNLNVTGTVYGWTKLAKNDDYYEGGPGCQGVQTAASNPACPPKVRIPELIEEAVKAVDASVDFRIYDNDGPDGMANSGDDDGFVDFLAIVHPEAGSECGGAANDNIWSHKFRVTQAGSAAIETADVGKSGAKIQIDSYVIQPAKACDGGTIQIGVFCHEFGHAFGLPDLYDVDNSSQGVGIWDLMGAGNYGGDSKTPSKPLHMGAWSKAQLGWVKPTPVYGTQMNVAIPHAEANPFALQLFFGAPVSVKQYFLVENRRKTGFDETLPAEGLVAWHVDERQTTNTQECVDDPKGIACGAIHYKVAVEQADEKFELEKNMSRGDVGDVFDAAAMRDEFSPCTKPWTVDYERQTKRTIAVKNIPDAAATMAVDVEYAEGWDPLYDTPPGDYGSFMVSLGDDADGDDVHDLIVGQPGIGVARLISGAMGTQLRAWNGVGFLDRFGGGIAGGNVAGDARHEVIVGAWERNTPTTNLAGVVDVYDAISGAPVAQMEGETVGARFGNGVAVVGRALGVPGGVGNILVGAPGTRVNGEPKGRAYLFDGTGSEIMRWDGENADDFFGEVVAEISDIDLDGVTDFAIAATLASPGGMTQAGRVYVHSGASGARLFTLDGPHGAAQFGRAIAPVGFPFSPPLGGHFAVGAPLAFGAGEVYVYHGATQALRRKFSGVDVNERFGASLAGGVNIDLLGGLDLAVGAPGRNKVYVFDVESGARVARLEGPPGKQLGLGVAVLADGDCDNRSEVAAGGFAFGRVYKGGPPQRTSNERLQDAVDGLVAADEVDIGDVVADLRDEAGLG